LGFLDHDLVALSIFGWLGMMADEPFGITASVSFNKFRDLISQILS